MHNVFLYEAFREIFGLNWKKQKTKLKVSLEKFSWLFCCLDEWQSVVLKPRVRTRHSNIYVAIVEICSISGGGGALRATHSSASLQIWNHFNFKFSQLHAITCPERFSRSQ